MSWHIQLWRKEFTESNTHASLHVPGVSFGLDQALILYMQGGVSPGFAVLRQLNSQMRRILLPSEHGGLEASVLRFWSMSQKFWQITPIFSGFDLFIEAQSCCSWSHGRVPASAWIMGICHQVPPKSASFLHPQPFFLEKGSHWVFC